MTWRGHGEAVRTCAFSPDGSRIVSGDAEGTVKMWDAASGTVLWSVVSPAGPVGQCRFSPDGAAVRAISGDGVLLRWTAASGTEIPARTLADFDEAARLASRGGWAVSEDGSRWASVSWAEHTVTIRDAATGRPIAILPDVCFPLAFSPRGDRVAAMPISGTAAVFDLPGGKLLWTPRDVPLRPAGSGPSAARWNPNPGRFWDNDDNAPAMAAYAFSPDGARLAALSRDGILVTVDAATGADLLAFAARGNDQGCRFSPDGARIISWGSTTVNVWDANTGLLWAGFEACTAGVRECDVSPDGARIAAACEDGAVRILDATRRPPIAVRSLLPGRVLVWGFSPHGDTLVVTAGRTLSLWDGEKLRAGEPLAERVRVSVHYHSLTEIQDCVFAPHAGAIVLAVDNQLTVRDAATGEERARLQGHGSRVEGCAISPDGSRLVTADASGDVRLWDMTTGACLRSFRGEGPNLTTPRFAPDGQQVLVGGDAVAREPTGSPFRIGARKLAISPMGTHTARWEGSDLELVDTGTGAIQRLIGHRDTIWSCRFSPDGRYLASVSHDRTLRVWDTASSAEAYSYWAEAFCSCAWHPDGRTLLAGGYFGGMHRVQLQGAAVLAEPV